MQTFVFLLNFTDAGAKSIKSGPRRRKQVQKIMKRHGGRLRDGFLTLGPYDRVIVADFPDDAAAAKFALGMGQLGFTRTTTLRAFDSDLSDELTAA